jgi:hypothetical protein
MHPYARDYIFYLRRRVEDYPVPDQPVPKWTELDHQAISLLLDELERLHRYRQTTAPLLAHHGLRGDMREATTEDELVSTYAVAPRARRDRALDLLLVLDGAIAGASARLIYEYASRF